ncbi:MAG: DUF3592 domain-containing protein [Lachnospiraceae bacterium]|nr:DUF3592 domain-containing protein [Lachnospiraceae bacterium]
MAYAIIGIIVLLIGAYILMVEISRRIRCTKQVKGKICAVVQQNDFEFRNSRAKVYHPVYEFEADGRIIKGHYKQYNKSDAWFQVGAEAKIRYNPDKPDEFVVVDAVSELVTGTFCALAGIVLIIIYYVRP